MSDLEKVIKGLESLRVICNAKSDMAIGEGKVAWAGYANTADDALALLKAQEPVKPERASSGSGITWWNICGNCKTAINPNDKFCHECGRAVKWDD